MIVGLIAISPTIYSQFFKKGQPPGPKFGSFVLSIFQTPDAVTTTESPWQKFTVPLGEVVTEREIMLGEKYIMFVTDEELTAT